jgi:hypothetical protein
VIASASGVLETQMNELTEREKLLESSGYRYHFARMHYVNRATRQVFSLEFVEAHSQQEIRKILETPPTGDWVFHFNTPPAEGVKQKLIEELEK